MNYQCNDLIASQSAFWTPVGEECINHLRLCGADGYDAVYTKEAVDLANNPIGSRKELAAVENGDGGI